MVDKIGGPHFKWSLIEFSPLGISLKEVWSETGNWVQVRLLHVVIRVIWGEIVLEYPPPPYTKLQP